MLLTQKETPFPEWIWGKRSPGLPMVVRGRAGHVAPVGGTVGLSAGPAPKLRHPCGGRSPAPSGGSAVGLWSGLGPTVHKFCFHLAGRHSCASGKFGVVSPACLIKFSITQICTFKVTLQLEQLLRNFSLLGGLLENKEDVACHITDQELDFRF